VTLVEAIVQGVVQGLTEFLPISSTAHLRIVPEMLGWQDPGAAFSAVIQLGTLLAVLVYFRRDLIETGRAWISETLRGRIAASHEGKLGWMMIIGTVPIVVGGLLLKSHIESSFRRLSVISVALIGFALLLMAAEAFLAWRTRRGLAGRPLAATGWNDAVVVGLAQALALIPGASRSGVTITASLFRGLERAAAARFSFLLSIPAVFAAGIFQLYKERDDLLDSSAGATALVVATLVSAVVGYAAIALLLRYLRSHTTYVFVGYRLALGALLLALVSQGKLPDLPSADADAPNAASPR
jgi:undecaprenyl-diphosphatase